ncbi:MAG: DEAD/DEAH box helicase [Clostridiales bacterium]|nr:DEAD/DEAH box helicase [Clostridiales bacterium]
MTEADRLFARFPYYIKEFIHTNGWESLRDIQLAAAKILFETDNNLLLTSSTASGKTEAAFFPILTELHGNMPSSIAVLYIAPLKSLINDQFSRLDALLDISGVPVYHWHGDVSTSHKTKMLKEPRGILQITPESLESMLINRSNDIVRIFGDLRYVIIDEVHTLTGSDRGNQIICQLMRISRLIEYSPRRVGLSATIGDLEKAAAWLGEGSGRKTSTPELPSQRIKWRLGLEHFYIQNPALDQTQETEGKITEEGEFERTGYAPLDPGYEYLYDCVKDKKSLIFSNSREETEYVTATLRQIAAKRQEPDIFLIHHGNLSAAIREEAELKMKDEELPAVTCATVTMELGIDIGKLERVAQVSSPNSVSSFLQRLGRSGRRGNPPEMMMVFREETPLPNTPLPQMIPWDLLRAIAIIQLYIEERFIEPPAIKKLPFSLAFQQTLSILASTGELTPKKLAERFFSLPPFAAIPKEDYKTLLLSMIKNDFIEMTDERGLIVGLAGERLTNSFKFYAVFKDSEDFTVRFESSEIGTITTPPPVGDRFALAGRVWEVTELDIQRRLIYVKSVEGKMEISWPGDYGEIHTRILERMKQVLSEDTIYPYLKPNAAKRLQTARHLAASTGLTKSSLIHLGGYNWCLFPWLGTRSFRTLRRYLALNAKEYDISGIEYDGCYYITFKMEPNKEYALISGMDDRLSREGIDLFSLVGQKECPVFDKYDNYIPPELLRKAYATDRLRADEVIKRIRQIKEEF